MKICCECGIEFHEKKSYQKFCGKKCCARFHSINQDKEVKIGTHQRIKECSYCKKSFNIDRRRKFCSFQCKTKGTNQRILHERSINPDRRKILDEICIKERKRKGIDLTKPIRNPNPKGSGHINKRGYKIIKRHGHPNAHVKGSIGEHIWVMSEFLGRALFEKENVHHINGIRHDNRIENLELWTTHQPSGQCVEDKINWCKEFLTQYGYKIDK
jgi:hypothetical protein